MSERGCVPSRPSAFTETANQAASLPAVAVAVVGTIAMYLGAQRWWSDVGDAFRVVPILYTLVVLGAAIMVALLATRARLLADQRVAWIATGIAVAGVAAFGQATAIMRLADAPHIDPDGLAALYLLWHAALVVFAVGALLVPTATRLRWGLVGVFACGLVVVVADPVAQLLPQLVDTKDVFTPLYGTLRNVLTVAAVGVAGWWLVACGPRPNRTQIWIGIALVLAACDLVVAAGADTLFASMWWSSAALRAAQFAIPGVGLLADGLRLLTLLHVHEASLYERLEHERDAALRRLAGPPDPGIEGYRVRAVIDRAAFRTVFQPIYSLDTGQMLAVEALTRFTAQPVRPPDRWFAEAARCDLGTELELVTADAAITAARNLPSGVALALNLSPATLADPRTASCLQGARTPLIIELTEHAEVDDYPVLARHLAGFRAAGVQIAIDDAGAGFASFQHVVQLAPDLIKLDMSLTRGIHRDPVRRALAESLSGFAEQMGIRLLAEGVETRDELTTLQRIGTHAAQGYLLAEPGPLPTAAQPSTIPHTFAHRGS